MALNGAANEGGVLAPSPLAQAQKAYFEALEIRCKADASPLNPFMLRTALDMNEALVEGLLDILQAKGLITREEIEAAQVQRLTRLAAIIKGSVATAMEAKRRVEIARTLPAGRG